MRKSNKPKRITKKPSKNLEASRSSHQVPHPKTHSNFKDERVLELDEKIQALQKRIKSLKYKRKRLIKKLELEQKEEGVRKFKRRPRRPKKKS